MILKLRRTVVAYTLLFPSLILLGIFTIYPILDSLYISFFRWDIMSTARPFVGLQNYIHIFTDPLFLQALLNTVEYVVFFVPIVMIVGLLAALLLNSKVRFLSFFRTIMFLPYITSLAATGVLWQWLFNDQFGLVNYFLQAVGLPSQDWLNNQNLTMFTMVLFGVWQNLGYVAVIFLAGLQNVSKEAYEAADVDGASALQKVWHITLPLLSPTTYFVLLLSTIEAFRVFLQVYVLYGQTPGPNNSGMTLLYYMYEMGFNDYKMGYASATAYVLFLITFIVTLIQMTLSRRVHYDQ
nr:sugar ABC transporter permease [Bacilli bacterium]